MEEGDQGEEGNGDESGNTHARPGTDANHSAGVVEVACRPECARKGRNGNAETDGKEEGDDGDGVGKRSRSKGNAAKVSDHNRVRHDRNHVADVEQCHRRGEADCLRKMLTEAHWGKIAEN